MRVSSITVKNFKCYTTEVTVRFDQRETSLISGSNGTGKTTLLEALQTALTIAHNSKAQSVLKLRPWGTDLAPEVTIVFETAQGIFQVYKRFLQSPKARLNRWTGSGWKLLAEGAQVQDSLVEVLGGNFLERLPILLTTQDALPVPALSETVVDSIRGTLGAQVSGSKVRRFEELVAIDRGKYLTPKGHDKVAIAQAEENLTAAKAEAESNRAVLSQIKKAQDEARTARSTHDHLRRQLDTFLPELNRLEAQEKQAEAINQEIKTAVLILNDAQNRFTITKRRTDEIVELRQNIFDFEQKIRQADTEEQEITKRLQTAIDAFQLVEQERGTVRMQRAVVDQQQQRAAYAQDYVRITAALEQATLQYDHVREANKKIEVLRGELVGPTPTQAFEMTRLEQDLAVATATLRAQLLNIDVETDADLTLFVKQGEPAGRHDLAGGTRFAVQAEGTLEISFLGFATMRCSGPVVDVGALRSGIQSIEDRRQSLLAQFGAASVPEFEKLAHRRTEIAAEISEIETNQRVVLGSADPGSLPGKIVDLDMQRTEILISEPKWQTELPDYQQMADASLQSEKLYRSTQDDVEQRFQAALQERNECQRALEVLHAEARNWPLMLGESKTRLSGCEVDGKSDSDRQAELDSLTKELEQNRQDLAQKQKHRQLLAADIDIKANEAREEVANLRTQIAREEITIRDAEITQRTLLQNEPYDRLSGAEEKLAEAKRRYDDLVIRRDAIKELVEVLESEKDAALNNISEPVSAAASQILETITGQKLADIRLNRSFALASLDLKEDVAADISNVSAGESEQIYAATRIALADVLLKDYPHIVVFDDVFAHTDNERLGRIIGLLQERSSQMQFVILTCHPERFASWKDANWLHVRSRNGRSIVEGEPSIRAAS